MHKYNGAGGTAALSAATMHGAHAQPKRYCRRHHACSGNTTAGARPVRRASVGLAASLPAAVATVAHAHADQQ